MYNSIYPAYQNPYLGINNNLIHRKKEEEKKSQSSNNAENNPQENRKPQTQSQFQTQSYFPNGEKVAIDYTRRRIGIQQVLSDFKNTANAIGAPDNIKAEVDSYLALIENQAGKDIPNPQIIQSNLKSASQILDEYITETLKKPSKVVENWVDTLFLQQIDYKAETPLNPQTIKETKADENAVQEVVSTEEYITEENGQALEQQKVVKSQNNLDIYVPQDPQLKRLFIQAKKFAAINQKERALYSFQNVREYAEEIGDIETSAMTHFEEARLYDGFDKIEDALYNYDRASRQTSDNNIKAKSHMYMGKIYDDFVRLDPAIEHYCAAVSYAGEADNLKLQSKVLSDIAQIQADKYDKQNAMQFMGFADTIVRETKDPKLKGYVSAKNARNCQKLGENVSALHYYGDSTKSYSDIKDSKNMAKNYLAAAEVMIQYGNKAKAKKLLGKAYIASQDISDTKLKQKIASKIELVQ